MARKATSKPGSGTSQSSATIGFEAKQTVFIEARKLRTLIGSSPSARATAYLWN